MRAPGTPRSRPERRAPRPRSSPRSTARVAEFERSLTSDTGLPGRSWYRHFVYAPGAYTGYGVKTLPAVREALEERRWNDVNPNAAATAKVIARAAEQVKATTALLASP